MRELFFQVVPIVLILLVFYAVLRVLFFKPLLKVIAEREARTIGAQKAAEEAQKAASEKVKQYQGALKKACTEVFVEEEAAGRKALDARAPQLKEARAKTGAFVNGQRERVTAEVLAARREIESSIPQFAAL